jgi:hypothetical protein
MAEEISPLENHGWWMEQLRKDAKANRPEALRLADRLEDTESARLHLLPYAAAELRRLHAENERLHQINQSHEMKLSVRGYEIQIEDLRLAHAELRERNAELLGALKAITAAPDLRTYGLAMQNACIAIARAEGEAK